MRIIPSGLGARLNLFLLVFILVLGSVTAAVVYLGFRESRDAASATSQQGLERIGRDRLLRESTFQSLNGSVQLSASGLIAQEAVGFLVDSLRRGVDSEWSSQSVSRGAGGQLIDPRPDRTSDVFVPSFKAVDAALERDLRDSAILDALFPTLYARYETRTLDTDFDAIAIYFDTPNNVTRYYPAQGFGGSIRPDYDVRSNLALAGPQANPQRTAVWSPPYEGLFGQGLLLTVSAPVYQGDEFRGVVSVDLSLSRLLNQLNEIKPTEGGFAFFVDVRGQILRNNAFDVVDQAMSSPGNAAFARTIQAMRDGQSGVDRVSLGGRDVFVAYAPLNGPGGSLALVAPIDELTAPAGEVSESILSQGNQTVLNTIVIMAALFAAGLIGAAYLIRRMVLVPIESMVRATRIVAAGSFNAQIPIRSDDEIGVLARAFERMTLEVQERSDALKHSESELRALFEAMRDVVLVIDVEGRYLSVAPTNPSEIMRPPPDLVGRRMADVMPAEQAASFLSEIRAAIESGQTQNFEYMIDSAAGDIWFEASASAASEQSAIVVIRDVSAWKAAETALRERELQYRSIFESVSDGLTISTLDGKIVEANRAACELHGYTYEEFLQLPAETLVQEDFPLANAYEAIRQEQDFRVRTQLRRKDGSVYQADVHGIPFRFRGAIHVLSILRDVTEEVAAQQLLEERVAERTRELAGLLEVSRNVAANLDLRDLAGVALDQLASVVPYSGCSILTLEGDDLVVLDTRGPLADEPFGRGFRFALERSPYFRSLVANGEPVLVEDVSGDSVAALSFREALSTYFETDRFSYMQCWMATPMRLAGRVVGLITTSSDQAHVFTGDHSRLVRAVADQVAIAVENARLYEGMAARTRELTALLDVAHNLSSTLDLRPLLDLTMEQMKLVTGFEIGAVLLINDGRLESVAAYGHPDQGRNAAATTFDLRQAQRVREVLEAREPIIIADVRGDAPLEVDFREAIGEERLRTDLASINSWLGIPISLQERPIGLIGMSHPRKGHFTSDHARLARAIGDQAALAIQNARLFTETQQRVAELQTLYLVDEQLFRTLDLDQILHGLVDVVVDKIGAPKAMVAVWDGHHDRGRVGAARNVSQATQDFYEHWTGTRVTSGQGIEPQIAETADAHSADVRPHFDIEGIVASIELPIWAAGELAGALEVAYTDAHRFTPEEQRLLFAIADRAGVAIANAELYGRAQQAASLEERQRLARELHDSVSQALYGIALGARTARTLLDRDPARAIDPVDYVLQLAEAGLAEMRALIFELRPESLATEGLVAALQKQIAATRARYGIDVTAELSEEPELALETKEALYRIGQEALHNTVKHARATKAIVRLAKIEGVVLLEVSDDGAGFDPSGSFPGHMGLHSMRERAQRVSGELHIRSAPGEGATISVRVPLASTSV